MIETEVGETMSDELAIRRTAIHLLRSGKTPAEVAHEVKRSLAWVYKWRKRYFEAGDWQALVDRSRAPKHVPKKLPVRIRQAIRAVRSELEAEAAEPGKLSYIGAHAIQGRLRQKRMAPLPSISSIEREVRAAGMTRPRKPKEPEQVLYPHLCPTQPHQLVQVDIVPRYLPGGPCVSCFNAIDVVSRYPTGEQYTTKSSGDAVHFLLQVWRDLGVPGYTQVDNESCFSGGFTHPGVLGKVLRLGLMVGTELVFSPIRHPESNGYVERFHQDYTQNVWDKIDLPDLAAVRKHSPLFFAAYRHSRHHSALQGRSPQEMHSISPVRHLSAGFRPPAKWPLTVGKVHFIRAVSQERQIMLLNQQWEVSAAKPDQGVWATLQFSVQGARLRIYDAAPDAQHRTCLAEYPFPLKDPAQPLRPEFQRHGRGLKPSWAATTLGLIGRAVSQWVSTML
jgi:transposase InsO family protein